MGSVGRRGFTLQRQTAFDFTGSRTVPGAYGKGGSPGKDPTAKTPPATTQKGRPWNAHEARSKDDLRDEVTLGFLWSVPPGNWAVTKPTKKDLKQITFSSYSARILQARLAFSGRDVGFDAEREQQNQPPGPQWGPQSSRDEAAFRL